MINARFIVQVLYKIEKKENLENVEIGKTRMR